MRAVSTRIAAVLLVVLAGCDRAVTAPAVSSAGATRSLLGSPATVTVVKRNTPLATSLSVSKTIGVLGGTISLPGAGLTIVVPALAVASPTTFTVTAVAGNQVAYEFEPHGTQFLVPLIATQSLVGTDGLTGGLLGGLLPKPLVAGHFLNLSDLNPLAGTASVTELLAVSVNLPTKTATFTIPHFSGWLVASGKTGTASSDEASSSQ